MENLSKINFWNDLMAKYPHAMKHFSIWIDDYKQKNNWERLFNSTPQKFMGQGIHIKPSPKFHDLPLAMQVGIFIQYVFETPDYSHEIITGEDPKMEEWAEYIEEIFKSVEGTNSFK